MANVQIGIPGPAGARLQPETIRSATEKTVLGYQLPRESSLNQCVAEFRELAPLHILSDLHTEFADFGPPETDAKAVILAGDIGVGVEGVRWGPPLGW